MCSICSLVHFEGYSHVRDASILAAAFDSIEFFGLTVNAISTPLMGHRREISDITLARYRRTMDDNGFQRLSTVYAASGFVFSFLAIALFIFFATFFESHELFLRKSRAPPEMVLCVDEEIALLAPDRRDDMLEECRL
eukprot:GEMP01121181.1.p1 GENE.GEMP01121181.1~~GEMP01121181.1.p1  ORF type:complete len:138 (+),score=23.36 GEMP01121181.1:75-488(+)